MSQPIRVFVADDHPIVRRGIRDLLETEPQLDFVGEAANGQDFLDLIRSTSCDVVLMDIEMPVMNGIEAAKEVCRNTRGPIASIFYQGLDRIDEGLEMVEKSIISYGGVQMGMLEKNLSWISLFISIAPMLGFLGTVLGMIQAFASIREAGDVGHPVALQEETALEQAFIDTTKNMLSQLVKRNEALPPTEVVRITTMSGCGAK